jgi:hypothetical protein
MSLPRAERMQAAAQLRRVLDMVRTGDLSADGPVAVAVVRRLEGVLLALEAIDANRTVPSSAAQPEPEP